jgi:transmembrane sensor
MSHLPERIGDALDDVSVESVDRVARAVRARRARDRAQHASYAPVWGGVAALAVAIAVAILAWWPRPTLEPLRLRGGHPLDTLVVTQDAPTKVALAGGSEMVLRPGTSLRTLANDGRSVALLLDRGSVEIDVVPGGPRRWVLELGLATVEVVGTHFVVEREPDSARVSVERGAVLVRSEHIQDRVRRLGPGEDLRIDAPFGPAPDGAPVVSATPLPSAAASPNDPAIAAPSASVHSPPHVEGWRELAARKSYREAYDSLGPAGLGARARSASVDDLLTLADIARLSGHPADAVPPLTRIVQEHGGDRRAAMAAFTLGNVELDSLGRASSAAGWFSRALSLGLPSSLQEDAMARTVEAHARSGNPTAAGEARERYISRFPGGPHRGAVERWAGQR